VLAATYTEKLDWFGTLRPRIGYSLGNWLLYATGGGVLGEVGTDATAVLGPLAVTNSRSQTRGGWTVGGGVEVEIARGWSARIQYLYLDLGSHTTTYLPTLISNTAALRADVISGGVDYHF
jgi:outer membrane immunogenic protein